MSIKRKAAAEKRRRRNRHALRGTAPDSGSSQPSGTPPEKPGGGSSGDSSFTENGETLTGDCVITSLTNNGTINFNGYTITLAGGTVLQ